ncbi:prepilin peptidase [Pseudophaeobacter sp.]|uniref:prepilin peptidase n=1 Tax=Pseudophaeobacter sp. TaxID=1971739 RepID=UPI0032983F26
MLLPAETALPAPELPLAAGVFLLLLAPAIGSFLGVLVDRLPRGEDVLWRRSQCRSCAAALAPWELLPILSFCASGGRCRHCGAAIPAWALYLEIAALGVAVLALAAGGGLGAVLFSCLFLWGLLALALCDLLWLRLPDPLTAGLFLVVLIWAGSAGLQALGFALLGAGLGLGSFYALRWGYQHLRGREGLGLGDVKLMAALGGFAGPLDLPLLVLIAALTALGGGGIAHLRRPEQASATGLAQQPLPFGAALCAAAALLWLLRGLDLLWL